MRARIVRATQDAFTVSAAAVISNSEGKVLLLNHVLRPYAGWGFPGGFVEKGEQAEDAIRREIREETGIEISRVELYTIHTTNAHIEILFSAKSDAEAKANSAEIIEARWFSPDNLPAELGQTQRRQIREILSQNREQ